MCGLVCGVDDEPAVETLFRQQFRRVLKAQRVIMDFAVSAANALTRIARPVEQTLILILSDINMHGMTGLEMLPKVREMRPDVPILMSTAYGDLETQRKATEGGATGSLTKPIHFPIRRAETARRCGPATCPAGPQAADGSRTPGVGVLPGALPRTSAPARCKVSRSTVSREVTVTMPSCFMAASPPWDGGACGLTHHAAAGGRPSSTKSSFHWKASARRVHALVRRHPRRRDACDSPAPQLNARDKSRRPTQETVPMRGLRHCHNHLRKHPSSRQDVTPRMRR